MISKTYTLVLYALICLGLVSFQTYFKGKVINFGQITKNPKAKSILLSAIFFVYYFSIYRILEVYIFFIALIFTLLFARRVINRLKYFTLVFFSISICFTLLWWKLPPVQSSFDFSLLQCFSFTTTLFVCYLILVQQKSYKLNPFFLLIPIALAIYFSFNTYPQDNSLGAVMATWHHWAAYVGPAETLLAGARPFYDIPLQYGLGPTLLVSLACFKNCWSGSYYLFSIMIFLYFSLLSLIILKIEKNCTIKTFILICTILIACIFWTAYPPNVDTPLLTPSTSGMRFVPALLLACTLIYLPNSFLLPGVFWLIALVYSPESAFMTTYLYLGIHVRKVLSINKSLFNLFYGLIKILLILSVFYLFLMSFYYYETREFFSPYIIAIYMFYPPGEMPVNWRGPICFYLFSLIWSIFISRKSDSHEFNNSFILQLLALSALSYFLGRSHDNNILNLMPFAALLLIDSLVNSQNTFQRVYPSIAISFLCSAIFIFGWDHWDGFFKKTNLQMNSMESLYLKFSYNSTILPLAPKDPDVIEVLKDQEKLAKIIYEKGERYEFLNTRGAILPEHGNDNVWSGLHTYINFRFIPSSDRILFLQRSSEKLKRSGWLIVDKNLTNEINNVLDEYKSVYSQVDFIELPTCYAIKFEPKQIQ